LAGVKPPFLFQEELKLQKQEEEWEAKLKFEEEEEMKKNGFGVDGADEDEDRVYAQKQYQEELAREERLRNEKARDGGLLLVLCNYSLACYCPFSCRNEPRRISCLYCLQHEQKT
jgi:hypothetical protein